MNSTQSGEPTAHRPPMRPAALRAKPRPHVPPPSPRLAFAASWAGRGGRWTWHRPLTEQDQRRGHCPLPLAACRGGRISSPGMRSRSDPRQGAQPQQCRAVSRVQCRPPGLRTNVRAPPWTSPTDPKCPLTQLRGDRLGRVDGGGWGGSHRGARRGGGPPRSLQRVGHIQVLPPAGAAVRDPEGDVQDSGRDDEREVTGFALALGRGPGAGA